MGTTEVHEVYLVVFIDWEDHEIESAWLSFEKAKDEAKRLAGESRRDVYVVETVTVMDWV